MNQNLLKATYRLSEGEFCTDMRNIIFLSKKSYLSKLMVLDVYNKTHHGGSSAVLAFTRAKYWIVHTRQLIKRILERCFGCLRFHGKSAMGLLTVLPTERIAASRPFETTSLDFTSPLYTAAEDSRKRAGRRRGFWERLARNAKNCNCILYSLIKNYLKRWRNVYLCQLKCIHHSRNGSSKSVKVKDVVLLHEDNKPRLWWRLGVVKQTYQGRNDRIISIMIYFSRANYPISGSSATGHFGLTDENPKSTLEMQPPINNYHREHYADMHRHHRSASATDCIFRCIN
uniref:DUF5641 domain-containing protein n=1 Tax=Glossina austeni TaxID=7395 RepID=A0A1A9V3K6_GLOAU